MRKVALGLVTVVAIVVAAACSSGGGGGGGTPNPPTPTPFQVSYIVNGSGFGGHNGDVVGVRVLQGTSVVFCSTAGTVSGATFNLTETSALAAGVALHGEAYVSQDGNTTYDLGDLTYYDPSTNTAGTFTTTSARTWSIANGQEQPISWMSGTGCP
jgi:hypothetical protein